jgi:hypothetical protein
MLELRERIFPHSLEIPSGFPHSHGLGDWIYVFSSPQLEPTPPQGACNECLRSTLAAFAVVLCFQEIRAGVAGRNGPAEEGGGGHGMSGDREETSSHWLNRATERNKLVMPNMMDDTVKTLLMTYLESSL